MTLRRPGYGPAMALRDLLARLSSRDRASAPAPAPASGGAGGQAAPVRDDQPGSVSSQQDVGGRGPVGLQDRTAPGGQASPDTNQAKTEPMPATPGEADPNAALEPPELGEMNIGAGDPQLPEHPLARPRDVPLHEDTSYAGGTLLGGPVNSGVAPHEDRPALDSTTSTGTAAGPERPAQATEGTARRAPASLGVSPEEQETDVDAGRSNMTPLREHGASERPGDAQGIGEASDQSAEGTSEQQHIASGIRMPQQD